MTVANRRGSTCGRCPCPGWEAEGAGVPAPARGRGQRRTRPAPVSLTAHGWVSSSRGCAALRGRCSHRPPGTHLCFWPGLCSPGCRCGGVLPLGRKGWWSCEGEPKPWSLRSRHSPAGAAWRPCTNRAINAVGGCGLQLRNSSAGWVLSR